MTCEEKKIFLAFSDEPRCTISFLFAHDVEPRPQIVFFRLASSNVSVNFSPQVSQCRAQGISQSPWRTSSLTTAKDRILSLKGMDTQ